MFSSYLLLINTRVCFILFAAYSSSLVLLFLFLFSVVRYTYRDLRIEISNFNFK